MAALLTRKQQVALKINATPTSTAFDATVLSATSATMKVEDVVVKYNVEQNTRNPQRSTIGNVQNVPGAISAQVTFRVPVAGNGFPGTAPSWGAAMRACGWVQTVNSGSASVGTQYRDPRNTAGSSGSLAITGTYGGAFSGFYKVTATEVSGAPSVTIQFYSFDANGQQQGYTSNAVANIDGTPQAFGDGEGLSIAIGTAVFGTVGNSFYIPVTSADTENVTYTRSAAAAIPYASLAVYQDGVLHKIRGVQGNVSWDFPKTGSIGYMNFTFMGVKEAAPSDSAMLTGIAYEDSVPPAFKGVTTSINGSAPNCYTSFAFDSGNRLQLQECAAETDGYLCAYIDGYEMTGAINPVQSVVATFNPFTDYFGGTASVVSLSTIGTDAGNRISITSVQQNYGGAQYTDLVQGDRNGQMTADIALRFSEPEYDSTEAAYGASQMTITVY